MTATVTGVQPKGEKAAMLVMSEGPKIWTPDIEKAKELLGKPIPESWEQKNGQYGPQALPPRDKRNAPAAWRNTKEGAEAEHRSILARQREREDASHRRTALMQSVAMAAGSTPRMSQLLEQADTFYNWLLSGGTENEGRSSEGLSRPSESSGGGRADVLGEGTEVHSPPDSPPAGTDPPSTAGDGRGTGEAAGSPSPHQHLETTGKMATDGHRHRWRDRVCQDCGLAWGQG